MKTLKITVFGTKENFEVKIPFFMGDEKNNSEVAEKYMVNMGSNVDQFIYEQIQLGNYKINA